MKSYTIPRGIRVHFWKVANLGYGPTGGRGAGARESLGHPHQASARRLPGQETARRPAAASSSLAGPDGPRMSPEIPRGPRWSDTSGRAKRQRYENRESYLARKHGRRSTTRPPNRYQGGTRR